MEPEPADSPDYVQKIRESLKILVDGGGLLNARELLKTLRPAFPEDTWLATMEAYVHLRLGSNEQAAEVAAEALSLGSDDPMAVLVLGTAHRNRGRHVQAAEVLLDAHRRLPGRVDAACMLVEETAAAHGLERARSIYDEVFDRLPDHSVAICWAKLLFEAGVDGEMPVGAVSAPVMSVPAWTAQAGSTLDFIGPRENTPVETPPVFGEPDAARFKVSVPGYIRYASTLRGATIFAKSGIVLMPDGVALNDTIADERFGRFLDLRHDKTVVRRRGERLLLDVGQYPVTEIEAGVMLSGWVSEHFGHWVPEYLCRVSYLERHPLFAELPIIVDSDMPAQHLEYLSLLVPNRIVQIPAGEALRCGELVVASPSTFFPVHLTPDHNVPPQNQGGLPTDGFRFLQNRVLQHMPAPSSRRRKLYLSRKSRTWRNLVNEDAISDALAARGFEILFPEDLSFEEQVKMYQAAKVVVAPNGSSLLNAIFAPKDMTLVILSQRGLFNWGTYYGLMRELGYDLTFLCGDEETDQKHANYSIPLPRLIAALEALSA
ncbi:glycosyltransferase family 61 protein [Phenylobacterium sp.]|jgi:capsular polysaccharide biosynthesis protein|uniref:glycosyltransferase family 61 protein n=1 Tax=Phenylobacterium sp. TaxID=1871053 RepID=UPI002E3023E8|nr:glycosyltransferase family 61 protein [Phenylobacterium sp.]HEX4709587.1 glycosyltransferase family 61 protein [Phenylobacterium sp.]